ncbi:poly(A) polymerase [Rodentibacter pneumotropicus]|uniref:Poly(A) polymerase n=1 Tax=Rodentibacter pneumotropicus TaxID=758 RepID=A0A3S4UAA0_9PAST|nr:poly(A) polymerase [Rodentibacter pneumotropicus]
MDLFCQSLAAPRRHTTVIRDIWFLQLQLLKRTGSAPVRVMEHPKFRAAFDLLAMRAELEGGDTIELAKWWHEYQFSNNDQRNQLVKEQQSLHPKPKKKYFRSRKRRKARPME